MSTTRKHGGTGLGLTDLPPAGRTHGRADLARQRAGRRDHVLLHGLARRRPATGLRQDRSRAAWPTLRALIVDDNAAAREILARACSGLSSAAVRRRRLRPEAIAAVQQADAADPYDIVFMDWRMPGMDGLQASRAHQERRVAQASAGDRHGHGVRTRGGARGSRAAATRRLPGQARDPVDARGHARERLCRRRRIRRPPWRARGRGDRACAALRILLVEDNEINQQIAVELLEGVGAKVDVANNGREAVDMLFGGPTPPPYRRGAHGPADARDGRTSGDREDPLRPAFRGAADLSP